MKIVMVVLAICMLVVAGATADMSLCPWSNGEDPQTFMPHSIQLEIAQTGQCIGNMQAFESMSLSMTNDIRHSDVGLEREAIASRGQVSMASMTQVDNSGTFGSVQGVRQIEYTGTAMSMTDTHMMQNIVGGENTTPYCELVYGGTSLFVSNGGYADQTLVSSDGSTNGVVHQMDVSGVGYMRAFSSISGIAGTYTEDVPTRLAESRYSMSTMMNGEFEYQRSFVYSSLYPQLEVSE